MHRFIKPLVAAVALAAGLAHAAFPERPVTIVVPYAPGGAADAVARVIATRMGARLGTSVIVDNKAGASGTIGASFVAKAPADGYTMLYDATPYSINPHLFPRMPYASTALQPLSLVLLAPNVLIVKADSPSGPWTTWSPAPRRSPASSTSPRAAAARCSAWRRNCSASNWAWTWCMSPTRAAARRSRT